MAEHVAPSVSKRCSKSLTCSFNQWNFLDLIRVCFVFAAGWQFERIRPKGHIAQCERATADIPTTHAMCWEIRYVVMSTTTTTLGIFDVLSFGFIFLKRFMWVCKMATVTAYEVKFIVVLRFWNMRCHFSLINKGKDTFESALQCKTYRSVCNFSNHPL